MTPMTRMVTIIETAAFFDGGDSLDLTVERILFTSGDIRKQWSEATVVLNGTTTTIRAQRTADAIETVSKAVRFVGEVTNDQSVIGLASEVLAFGFNNLKRWSDLDARTADGATKTPSLSLL